MTTTEQLPITAEEAPAVAEESRPAKDLRALAKFWFADRPLAERVALLNELRGVLAEFSPFQTEPVDFVEWVPADAVHGNEYNPNVVAPPEMELLRLSIMADGYTQPIVTMPDDDGRVSIRIRSGRRSPSRWRR